MVPFGITDFNSCSITRTPCQSKFTNTANRSNQWRGRKPTTQYSTDTECWRCKGKCKCKGK